MSRRRETSDYRVGKALRTIEEVFQAGLRAAAIDRPLTRDQVNHIALLVAPYIGKISVTDEELAEARIRGSGDPPLADWRRTAIAGMSVPYLNRQRAAEGSQ